jgi:predicted permease
VTLEQAQAEMDALTAAQASLAPDPHARLRGQVMAYTDTHTGNDDVPATFILVGSSILILLLTLVVLVPFANVAILVYARTATRTGEIAVRSALGASRRRVVTQLFAEALVLSALSAAAGIGLALFALDRIDYFTEVYLGSGMPFWAESVKNPWTIAYGVAVTVLAAVVAGVVPGLQATGKRAGATLKTASSGNGLRLGGVWTGLIVTQVAITVAILPLAGGFAWQAAGMRLSEATFPAEQYLTARLMGAFELDVRDNDLPRNAGEEILEVARRLEADARVTGVALSTRHPAEVYSEGFSDFFRIEIDGLEAPLGGHPVGSMGVDPGFFAFLGVPVDFGRELVRTDIEGSAPPVVVSRAFVDGLLAGANPIGRHVRAYRSAEEEPALWMEIVGVVGELQRNPLRPEAAEPRMFTPLDRSELRGAYLTVHTRSAPEDLVPDLRRIVTEVDPGLLLYDPAPLSEPGDPIRMLLGGMSLGVGFVLLSILLLCAAGVFSLMSFNVTQRIREIGIRSALGASPERVLGGVMARSARQLAIGVVVGLVIVAVTPPVELFLDTPVYRDLRLVVGVAAIMVAIGLLAAVGPARRGLRVQPTEALREA